MKKNLWKNILYIFLIFLLFAGIFSLFNPPDKPKEIGFNTLVEQIESGKVKEIKVIGNEVNIELHDGIKEITIKEAGSNLEEVLANYGVKSEDFKKINISYQEPRGEIWIWILITVIPLLFIGVFFWWILRQGQQGATQAFSFGKAKPKQYGAGGKIKEKVTFNDVAGLEEAKEELEEVVEFLRNPKKFLDMGARIPRGVLLVGPPGCGKCIIGESYIITNKGAVKIKDIPKYFRVDEKRKVYGCRVFTVDLNNLSLRKETPSHWFDLGKQKTIKITPQLGIEIEGTPEHPIVILDKESGDFKFKRLDQIKKGDILVINYNHQVFGNWRELPDEKTAYLLGLLCGDGGLTIKDKIYFSNQNKALIRFVNDYFKSHFGITLKKVKSRKYDWYISDRKIKEKFREYGITDSYSRGKEVPESILLGSKEYQVVFLRGLFDTDGSCDDKYSRIEIASASEKLTKQIQILLLNMGVISRLREKKANQFGSYYHYLEITGDFVKNFAEEISFGISEKQKRLEKILAKTRNSNVNLVFYQRKRLLILWSYLKSKIGKFDRAFYRTTPFKQFWRYVKQKRSLSKEGLDRLLEFFASKIPSIKNLPEYKYLRELGDNRFFFTPVKKIERNRKAQVYDFTVPSSHSFVANGLINHNTLLAKAVASEAGVPFFSISGSEFVEMFVGVGAARVRDLFSTAKKSAPAILFLDELDAVGRHRGAGLGGGHDEREQTLNQILVEMDGFERETNVIVLAATNRPDILDPALLRPGRFDRHVVLDEPDIKGREEILKIHSKGKLLAKDINLKEVAERTPGFSGADLANLVNEAAILAARRNKKEINQNELLESIEKVLLGPERKSHILSEKEKEIAAYHEAGHALVSSFLPETEPIRKISIISRGAAAGYTLRLPKKERYLKTKTQFLSDLATLLGGYTAERMIFNEVTTGASDDLKKATDLARKLVMEYGMSRLGPITFGRKESLVFLGKEITEQRNFSEEIAQKIDKEVERFIKEAEKKAKKILQNKKETLKKVAKVLIKKETVEREEFEELIKKHKTDTK